MAFLGIFLFALPVSKSIMSIAEIGMLAAWLPGWFNTREREFRTVALTTSKGFLYLIGIFLLFAVGLIWTSDFKEGFLEINIKHILLVAPLIIGSLRLNFKQLRNLSLAFVLGNVFVSVLILIIVFYKTPIAHGTLDIPSPFVQRPRCSLFIAYSILLVIGFGLTSQKNKTLTIVTVVILFLALIFLKGRVGQAGLLLMIPPFILIHFQHNKYKYLRYVFAFGIPALLAIGGLFSNQVRFIFTQAIAEIHQYQTDFVGVEGAYSSIGKRLVYYERYSQLVNEHPIIGIGTGDVREQGELLFIDKPFGITYDKPHNEFFETLVKIGFIGLFLFLVFFYKILRKLAKGYLLFSAPFMVLLIFSMLTDSTLGTQAGASFFAIFTSMYLTRR